MVITKEELRVNERILAREVRTIDQNGEQLGILKLEDALEAARDRGLDLVEVSPNSKPPVCRILDYGKYKYQQEKRQQESKKHQHVILVKEIKLRPKTGEHDIQVKLRHIQKFLEKGNKVKATIMFRGREVVHSDIGLAILSRIEEETSALGFIESAPKFDGKNVSMVIAPLRRMGFEDKKTVVQSPNKDD